MVCTRPNLAQVVTQICKLMSKSGKCQWEVVKWIFRYFKGTLGHGISGHGDFSLVGYVNHTVLVTWMLEGLQQGMPLL